MAEHVVERISSMEFSDDGDESYVLIEFVVSKGEPFSLRFPRDQIAELAHAMTDAVQKLFGGRPQ